MLTFLKFLVAFSQIYGLGYSLIRPCPYDPRHMDRKDKSHHMGVEERKHILQKKQCRSIVCTGF